MSIRTATEDDWPAIWPLVQATARTGETYALDPGLTSEQGRAMWMTGRVVVAEDGDGTILGSAKMGPNRDGPGAHIGTASFMVAEAARGRGVGRALGEHVVQRLREDGYRGIAFNAVVETNTAAVALWKSLGFTVVGTVPGAFRHPVHGYVGLHVMFLPLAPAAPAPPG